ncbi:MAG: hypothetical protein ACPW60_13850 [Methylohalobius sp. ZOD2]
MIATIDDLSVALDQAPWGVLILRQGRIAWINETLAALTGQAKSDFIGRRLPETALGQERNALVTLPGSDGPRRLRPHRIEPDQSGEVVYYQDVTEHLELQEAAEALHRRLQTIETIDPVTRLKNRRAILQELDRQISRSRRYHNPLSVIRLTLEMDGEAEARRKQMESVGQAIKDNLRWADDVGVLDERTFLLLLPETLEEDAKELAGKFLDDRAAFRLDEGKGKFRHGVTAWQQGDDLRKLLKRVEQDQEINLSALLS